MVVYALSQNDTAADIKVTASAAGKSIPVEHMLMHEGLLQRLINYKLKK